MIYFYQTQFIFLLIVISFVFIILNYSLLLRNRNSTKTESIVSYIKIPNGQMSLNYRTEKPIIQPKESLLKNIKFINITAPNFTGIHLITNKVGSTINGNEILIPDIISNVVGFTSEYVAETYNASTKPSLTNRPSFNKKRQIYPQISFSSPSFDTITSPGLYLVEVEYEEFTSMNIDHMNPCGTQ